jgi:cytidylate kinase
MRRYKQLIEKGLDVNLREIAAEIGKRDQPDTGRSIAPLKEPPGALKVDTTSLTINEVLDRLSEAVSSVFPVSLG